MVLVGNNQFFSKLDFMFLNAKITYRRKKIWFLKWCIFWKYINFPTFPVFSCTWNSGQCKAVLLDNELYPAQFLTNLRSQLREIVSQWTCVGFNSRVILLKQRPYLMITRVSKYKVGMICIAKKCDFGVIGKTKKYNVGMIGRN